LLQIDPRVDRVQAKMDKFIRLLPLLTLNNRVIFSCPSWFSDVVR
jgi:hypothetical protein